MRTKELIYELMIFKNGATFSRYDILNAMQQYAEEYHLSELLKLNKSDVISSLDLNESKQKLDNTLTKETTESLNEWLNEKRQ